MITILKKWFERYFSHPEAVALTVSILLVIFIFSEFGHILVPVIASIIVAYILNRCVRRLESWKFPHLLAVLLVYSLVAGGVLILIVWLLPLLFQQLANFASEIPEMFSRSKEFIINFHAHYPEVFSAEQVNKMIAEFNSLITNLGKFLLSFSIASITNIITIIIYLVLVPLLVFFFVKDRVDIIAWIRKFLPKEHHAMAAIWQEIDGKIGDFINGKIIEILLVALVTIFAFLFLGLNYAILLGVGVGLSTIIPYIGAILVTIPVIAVALLQWGLSGHFLYLAIVYGIIITLDGNVLVPILFSEALALHPVVIMLAVLIFGKLLGFWGVFFAVPLATLVDVLFRGWPVKEIKE